MLRWGSGSACSKPTRDLTQVLEYMFNIVEINCPFLVQGFEAVNINISLSAYETTFFTSLFERAFKMMKNGVYFIRIALLVAKLFKILIYAN